MNQTCLNFGKSPFRDAISRIRFGSHSDNLLISSWDSSLRLYDVAGDKVRLEASTEAALLDCCFGNESVAFSAASNGSICRYDLQSGICDQVGSHDDLATCVEYSEETSLTITAGWDKKIMFWDTRSNKSVGCLNNLGAEAESMSLSGFHLMTAVGTSVSTHDLRNLSESVQSENSFRDIKIKCVRPILSCAGFWILQGEPIPAGFAVGSFDGRVALEYFSQSNLGTRGYAFRCYPKRKDGGHHLVTVNDIEFSPSMTGVFVTGDNEGYAIAWDSRSKKRRFELPRHPNSVVSLSYNHSGHLLAVASSYSYQEASEREEQPQIFIHEMSDRCVGSLSAGSSHRMNHF